MRCLLSQRQAQARAGCRGPALGPRTRICARPALVCQHSHNPEPCGSPEMQPEVQQQPPQQPPQQQQQQQQSFGALGAVHTPAVQHIVPAVLAATLRRQVHKLGLWCKQHRLQEFVFGKEGSPVLAAAAAAWVLPVLPGGGFSDLFTNRVFLAGFWAWFTAQTLKIFTKRIKKGVWDIKAIVDSGGMPSSHSALCAGVTTAIAFENGTGSSAFALAVAFCSIVMYDAAGVRRHAGKQAEVLNQVIGELLDGHPVSDVKLKEVLGHTPLQVGCGAVLGVLYGILYPVPQPSALAAAAAQVLAVA